MNEKETASTGAGEAWPVPKEQLTQIVEGLLFVVGRVINLATLCRAVPQAHPGEVREVLLELLHKWADPGLGFHLVEVGNGYQFRSDPICAPYLREMLKARPLRLSRAALETLAIIAYRQPVTRAEIEDVRGVDVGGVLKLLIDKRLVRTLGKREEPGRPLIYGTSRDFLETFNLRSLKDLPTLQEFQELSEEHRAKVDAAYDREEGQAAEEEELFQIPETRADDSAAARDLLQSAERLVDAVHEADKTIKEVLSRQPYDERDDGEPGEAVAEVEVVGRVADGSKPPESDGEPEQ